MPRGSAPGERRGGRKPGVPNKLNAEVKAAIATAFTNVGGHLYLERIAETRPDVFCQLVGKLLPIQTEGTVKHEHVVRVPSPAIDGAAWAQQQPSQLHS